MPRPDGSISFYFFDVDDNLLFLPTKLYLWNAENQTELAVSSREFANVQNDLGRRGKWQPWTMRAETFRDFRDQPGIAASAQVFVSDIRKAVTGSAPWQGPSWPLLVHAAHSQRPIVVVTARGHSPQTIEAGPGACRLTIAAGDAAGARHLRGDEPRRARRAWRRGSGHDCAFRQENGHQGRRRKGVAEIRNRAAASLRHVR